MAIHDVCCDVSKSSLMTGDGVTPCSTMLREAGFIESLAVDPGDARFKLRVSSRGFADFGSISDLG